MELKAKVVGIGYYKPSKPVCDGDTLIVRTDDLNKYDKDALAVFDSSNQLIGYVANSDRTLSPSNRAKGNLSALQLRFELDLENKEYGAKVINAYKSCIYLSINPNNWHYIDESLVDENNSSINELKAQINVLIMQNELLETRVKQLELTVNEYYSKAVGK